MRYEAILVDLDGVIRHWRPSDESIETAFSLPVGSIRRAAFSPELIDLAVTGAIADEETRSGENESPRSSIATTRLSRDLESLGRSACVHAVVNSSQVGSAKPSEQVFRAALRQTETVPERALFIDDTPRNVAAAASLGVLSHVFVGRGALSSFLRRAGVLRAKVL